MNRRRNYEPLDIDEQPDGSCDVRGLNEDAFDINKSVCLALFLLIIGISFFALSLLHATGHFINTNGAGYGFFILGLLTFIPGFYHSRLAYYAWRGYNGYSFRSIPTF